MLVLGRHKSQGIIISTPDGATRIEVVVVQIDGDKCRIGIKAPREFSVHRDEVQQAIDRENGGAA